MTPRTMRAVGAAGMVFALVLVYAVTSALIGLTDRSGLSWTVAITTVIASMIAGKIILLSIIALIWAGDTHKPYRPPNASARPPGSP